uniref:HAD-superfamily hydrolase, subfamily IA, variant 3 n=1 Tax=Rhodopseudomonas palustris (strain BisA53) TaxID=316055 RepID=Q07IX4_RHOP5
MQNIAQQWRVEAVLLDMDGTLLDTERVYVESLTAVLTGLGYPDVEAVCNAMVGRPGPECQRLLIAHYGDGLPLARINAGFSEKCHALLQNGLPLKRGVNELLDALADAGWPVAVVTSSTQKTADQHLTLGGIRGRFERIITRDEVVHSKPAPDLYLLAARQLGIAPGACVAVEDSGVGIAAAFAAGTIPLMVPDLLQPSDETRAQCAAVLPDLIAVRTLLIERAGLGGPTTVATTRSAPS